MLVSSMYLAYILQHLCNTWQRRLSREAPVPCHFHGSMLEGQIKLKPLRDRSYGEGVLEAVAILFVHLI